MLFNSNCVLLVPNADLNNTYMQGLESGIKESDDSNELQNIKRYSKEESLRVTANKIVD